MEDIIITPVPIEDEEEFTKNKNGMTDEEYEEALKMFDELEKKYME